MDPLNILTFPTHERYDTNLAKTDHTFYHWSEPGIKRWDEAMGRSPENIISLYDNYQTLPIDLIKNINIDLILVQSRERQYIVGKYLQGVLNCPMVVLEHTGPHPEWGENELFHYREMRGDENVFITEWSRDRWGWGDQDVTVIRHGVDTDLFKPDPTIEREPHVLSVVADFINRNWYCNYDLWKETTRGIPRKILGGTPGLSEVCTLSELIQAYSRASAFLQTSRYSPAPLVVLEAMACECPPVVYPSGLLPEVIRHRTNGFNWHDGALLRDAIETLLADPDLVKTMGVKARQTVKEMFPMGRFVSEWNKVFEEVVA